MLIDLHPEPADMARVVIEGMERHPRQLPAWLLYDERGSRLFEAICEQPEYSLARTESMLLEQQADAIAAALAAAGVRSPLVLEFGAGNARKAGPLLEALAPTAYGALDISATALTAVCREIRARHRSLPVIGICCDYSLLERLPDHPLLRIPERLGFYPGSSIGNFDPPAACRLMRRFARLLGAGGHLLVGIDQPKPAERLEAAYNDRAGCSAAFALNLLERLNRELGGSFDPADFHYRAWWEADRSRIAMALLSRRDHGVQLAGRQWRFAADEPLITEYSYKYAPDAFVSLAAAAGWRSSGFWCDSSGEVALHLLGQADSVEQEHGPR